ncbi:hypothetical protein [Rhodococcus jostii]|uniref:hypothetical protein n=1 Tax=Rhodococcus jostii TaxID=132919 RepID=UPI00365ED933
MTTAQKLSRFLAEVQSELRGWTGRTAGGLPIAGVDANEFITAVAPALIRREGLILDPKGTRTHD